MKSVALTILTIAAIAWAILYLFFFEHSHVVKIRIHYLSGRVEDAVFTYKKARVETIQEIELGKSGCLYIHDKSVRCYVEGYEQLK
jgi:hypothetical protein